MAIPARSPSKNAATMARPIAMSRGLARPSVDREALAHGERAPAERGHVHALEARRDARAGRRSLEGRSRDGRGLGAAARREDDDHAARAGGVALLAALSRRRRPGQLGLAFTHVELGG